MVHFQKRACNDVFPAIGTLFEKSCGWLNQQGFAVLQGLKDAKAMIPCHKKGWGKIYDVWTLDSRFHCTS